MNQWKLIRMGEPQTCRVAATPELSSWRQRLQLLLEGHIDQLATTRLQPKLNSVVIEQGSQSTSVLMVSQGRLVVEQQLPGQAMRVLAEVGPGDLLGEMALFGAGEHSARVRVVSEPTELLSIERAVVLEALLDVELTAELLHMSSDRCRQSNQLIGLLLEGLKLVPPTTPKLSTPLSSNSVTTTKAWCGRLSC